MNYREMLDLLRSKGVNVDEYRNGFKVDGEEGLMKFWMVRVKDSGDDMYMFCCGFDMLGNGRLVISHKDYPMDENIFESLQDAIKRNEGVEYPADQILLMPDLDYYDSSESPREDDGKEFADLIYSCNDEADRFKYVCLAQWGGAVLSGTLDRCRVGDKVELTVDIRRHWDRNIPAEKQLSKEYDYKEFYADAKRLTELAMIEICEQMGVVIIRGFDLNE